MCRAYRTCGWIGCEVKRRKPGCQDFKPKQLGECYPITKAGSTRGGGALGEGGELSTVFSEAL